MNSVASAPPSGWEVRKLESMCLGITDGDWVETKDQGGTDYRLLQVSNIGLGTFRETGTFRYITQETFDRLRCTAIKPGHVLVSRMPDPVGRAWHVREMSSPSVTAVDVAIVEPDPEQLDAAYLAYYLNSPQNLAFVAARATGTTRVRITRRDLASFEFAVPPLQTQRNIAAFLATYDDVIENNSHRIKILEEMAQRIYREWFVEFRYPGHEAAPLVDSEVGAIPQGWNVEALSAVATTQYGYTESASTDPVGPRFLRGMDVNKASYVDWASVPFCPIDAADHAKYRLAREDVVIIRMADPGKVGIVEADVDAVFASYLIRIRPRDGRLAPYFLFYLLSSDDYQGFVSGASSGTTRKSLSAPLVTSFRVALPPIATQAAFSDAVGPMRALLNTLVRANATLRNSRDLLLPRLISGEIDVTDLGTDVVDRAA